MNTPTIIPAEKYDISQDSFSPAALEVVSTLQEAGFEAYLVGGCIRDLLLGRVPKDFDVSTSAPPEQVKKTFKNCRVIGRRFRIAHVRIDRELIEVTTFRANPHEKQNASRNELREGEEGQLIRDNVFGTCDDDAWRRDFSINALYYNPAENTILDYMDSVADIQNGILRSIGDMETRFTEDPVRMLRIIRFSAKFDFPIPDQATTLIRDKKGLISTVSAPRLFEEVLKLFHGGQAVKSFELLRQYGLFKLMFPFTSEYLIDGELSLPEKALANTDKRIQIGKRVIPAFLFSCLLWDPVREDAHRLMDQGNSAAKSWRIAMMDALRDQSQYVSVPRSMADTVIEIWTLHFRLISRKPNNIVQIMNDRRFRAAYDFMLLRASLSEIDNDLADWWTRIQKVEEEQQQKMIDELRSSNEEEDGEPNFNSVEYQGNHDQFSHNKANLGTQRNGYKKHNGKKVNAKNGRRRNFHRRRKPAKTMQDSNGSYSSNGNDGNSVNGNGSKQAKNRNNKTARSNPYRSRRKRVNNKSKREDSYF